MKWKLIMKWSKISRFVKKEKYLLFVLIIALILRLYYLTLNNAFWWDSYIYIGMGKAIYSFGDIGIWESFRPLVWPTIIGFFWKLGIPIVAVVKTLDLIFSLTAICLTYYFTKKLYNRTTAYFASLAFATMPLFVMYTGLALTEPLAISLGLIGLLFFIYSKEKFGKKKLSWLVLTGFFIALSFLTKFPLGILLPSILITIFLRKRIKINYFSKEEWKSKIKETFLICLGFFVTILPYLVLNYILYQNPLEPFQTGSWIVGTDTWLYNSGKAFYIKEFFVLNKIFLLSYLSIIIYIIKRKWRFEKYSIYIFPVILAIIYFSFYVPRKEFRYLTIILPFLSIMVANIIFQFYNLATKKSKQILRSKGFMIITTIVIILSQVASFNASMQEPAAPEIADSVNFIISNNLNGTFLSSNPDISIRLNTWIIPGNSVSYAKQIYLWQEENFDYIYLNSCDFRCPDDEENGPVCENDKEDFFDLISTNKLIYHKEYQEKRKVASENVLYHCSISIYEKI